MANKTKLLDKEVQRALLECIRLGMPICDSCAYAGIHPDSYHYFMAKAKDARDAGRRNEYTKFSEQVEKAKAEFVRNNVAIIQKAAMNRSWQAAAWLLERRRPKDYGQTNNPTTEPQEVTIVNDVPKR